MDNSTNPTVQQLFDQLENQPDQYRDIHTVAALIEALSKLDPAAPFVLGVDCNDDTLKGVRGKIEIRESGDGTIEICGWAPDTDFHATR